MKIYKSCQKLAVVALLSAAISACSTTVQPTPVVVPVPTAVVSTTPVVATTTTPAVVVTER